MDVDHYKTTLQSVDSSTIPHIEKFDDVVRELKDPANPIEKGRKLRCFMSKQSSCVFCRVFAWLAYFFMSIIIGGAADSVIEKQCKSQLESEDEETRKKGLKKKFALTVAYSSSISLSLMWLWKKADKEIQEYYK